MEEINVLSELIKLGPIVTVLVAIIVFLYKRLNKMEDAKDSLVDEIRESEKESLEVLLKVLGFMEKLEESDKGNHESILREIAQSKSELLVKIAELNN